MTTQVHVHRTYTVKSESVPALQAHAERVMDHLLQLEGDHDRLRDSTVSLDAASHTVEIEVLALGASPELAASFGRSAIQEAMEWALLAMDASNGPGVHVPDHDPVEVLQLIESR